MRASWRVSWEMIMRWVESRAAAGPSDTAALRQPATGWKTVLLLLLLTEFDYVAAFQGDVWAVDQGAGTYGGAFAITRDDDLRGRIRIQIVRRGHGLGQREAGHPRHMGILHGS